MKKKDKTLAKRAAIFKSRKKKQGYIRKEFWIKPGWLEYIKALINKLENQKAGD